MANTILGGSSNIIIDGSLPVVWEFTGLDNYGRVLNSVNVKVVAGLTPVANIKTVLPTIQSINGRNVTFNFDFNDFAGTIQVKSGVDNTINGEGDFILQYPLQSVVPISVGSSVNWVLPTLVVVP